jgi:hypothetical protein
MSNILFAASRVKAEGISKRKAAIEANIHPTQLWRAFEREKTIGMLLRAPGRPPLLTPHIKQAIYEKITVAGATANAMDNDQIRALATALVSEAHGLPDWIISHKTYATLKRDLKAMGIRFGKGTSTSEARMSANSVAVLKPFFQSLGETYRL